MKKRVSGTKIHFVWFIRMPFLAALGKYLILAVAVTVQYQLNSLYKYSFSGNTQGERISCKTYYQSLIRTSEIDGLSSGGVYTRFHTHC